MTNKTKYELVSIIIPFFNNHVTIEETLQSVENQTYPNIEIIVVNDGSSIESAAELNRILSGRENITLLTQDNQGAAAARNLGANSASGTYFIFLDSDDVIACEYVAKCLEVLTSDTNVKAVYSQAEFFGAKTGFWRLPVCSGVESLLKDNRIPCVAMHRSADFFRLGGFDSQFKTHEDWDYWIRVLQDGGTAFQIPEVLFFYRKSADGSYLMDQVGQSMTRMSEDYQKIYAKHAQLYLRHGLGYFDLLFSMNEQQKHNNLLSIRLVKPLVKMEQAISSANRFRKGFKQLVKKMGSVGKAYKACRQIYSQTADFQSVKYLLLGKNPADITSSKSAEIRQEGFVILSSKHTYYIAQLIRRALTKHAIQAEIIFAKPTGGYANKWHFVICPQIFKSLPKNFFAFQMEQSVSNRWFTKKYFSKLQKARAVFDYSAVNIACLQKNGIPFQRLYYLPVGVLQNVGGDNQDATQFEYDVVFYGDIRCERRQAFLDKLQEHFSVLVISDVFGDKLHTLLKKAKVIVNVHYYENALLETTRIYECLSLNKLVVSEIGSDQAEHHNLERVIDFVGIGDIDGMISKVRYWLGNKTAYESRIDSIVTFKSQPNQFDFYFNRFLLSQDLITFDAFYQRSADYVQPEKDFWCLSLPETVSRRKEFELDNHYGAWIFPGLRHSISWVGCGLSYKFMLKIAQERNLSQVTICEDDVLFNVDFEKRYAHIKNLLTHTNVDWDIFSGLVADLSKDTKIDCSPVSSNLERLYKINRLVSTVFNIYNHTSYQKIIDWDNTNHVKSNTIDRYIQNAGGINGLVASPFLVGHKEDLMSVLWDFQNTKYKDMIEKSQALLDQKISELNRVH